MNNTQHFYTVKWTQPYTEWHTLQEAVIEALLKTNNLKEANDVLAHIMGL